MLKLAKSQRNTKQHLEVELMLFEIIPILHSHSYPKLIGHILKNMQKTSVPVFMRLYD